MRLQTGICDRTAESARSLIKRATAENCAVLFRGAELHGGSSLAVAHVVPAPASLDLVRASLPDEGASGWS